MQRCVCASLVNTLSQPSGIGIYREAFSRQNKSLIKTLHSSPLLLCPSSISSFSSILFFCTSVSIFFSCFLHLFFFSPSFLLASSLYYCFSLEHVLNSTTLYSIGLCFHVPKVPWLLFWYSFAATQRKKAQYLPMSRTQERIYHTQNNFHRSLVHRLSIPSPKNCTFSPSSIDFKIILYNENQ